MLNMISIAEPQNGSAASNGICKEIAASDKLCMWRVSLLAISRYKVLKRSSQKENQLLEIQRYVIFSVYCALYSFKVEIQTSASALIAAGDVDNIEELEDAKGVMRVIRVVSSSISFIFLLSQGILAGLALIHLFIATSTAKDEQFATEYAPLANIARQLFYILSSVSLIAISYRISNNQSAESGGDKDSYARVEMWTVWLAYFMALVLTLIATPFDSLLHLECNENSRLYERCP